MKSSASSGKNSTSSVNSKSKKSTKDRDKRKPSTTTERNDQHSEKGSPNKDGSARKYAGIGPDSILLYSEQSAFEHLSDEICYGLAEDLSYKLRFVIHDALIKARLSGRNHILSSDVDATFEDLNIDKVYGATPTPNWIAFSEQSVYYLDDPVVNLIEIAEKECSYVQPGEITVTRKWLPETKDISKPLKNYFETMCLAVVSDDMEVRQFAFKDISGNNLIGPIVEWFYHFGYFLLSKDITYDCLTLSALGLIRALETSHVAPLIVSEKQLKLLVRLILQRLLRSFTTVEVLKPMCSILAILCNRVPIRDLVVTKINQKIQEIKENFTLPIVSIINALGIDAIQEIFLPNIDYFLFRARHTILDVQYADEVDLFAYRAESFDPEFISAFLQTYSILCREHLNSREVDDNFFKVFGRSLVPIWISCKRNSKDETKLDFNWRNVKSKLIKTRRKVSFLSRQRKMKHTLEDAFMQCYEPDIFQEPLNFAKQMPEPISHDRFLVDFSRTFCSLPESEAKKPACSEICLNSFKIKQTNKKVNPSSHNFPIYFLLLKCKSDVAESSRKYLTVGKRTLSIPVLKQYKAVDRCKECEDHSLMFYNL